MAVAVEVEHTSLLAALAVLVEVEQVLAAQIL
jgi:hypothetical protein